MTSATKRRPAKITRHLRHSTHMVLARYANFPEAIRARTGQNVDPRQLFWKGIGVVLLCAACVFSFFLVSNRHLFRREGPSTLPNGQAQRMHFQHEPVGPPAPKRQTAAKPGPYPTLTADGVEDDAKEITSSKGTGPARPAVESLESLPANASVATVGSPGTGDRKVTDFVLEKTAKFQNLGPVQLKLLRIDNKRGRYDLAMRKNGREFRRNGLRVNQRVTMKRTRLHLPQVVVKSINGDQVSGYLTEATQIDDAATLSPVTHRRHHARRRQRA